MTNRKILQKTKRLADSIKLKTGVHLYRQTERSFEMIVLIIDNSNLIKERLAMSLFHANQTQAVYQAGNEIEAEEILKTVTPDFIIIDIAVAQGKGLEYIRKAKGSSPKTTIIALFSGGVQQYRDRCVAAGADYAFEKTVGVEMVTPIITRKHDMARTKVTVNKK